MKTELTKKEKPYMKFLIAFVCVILISITETYAQQINTQAFGSKVREWAGPVHTIFTWVLGASSIISFFREIKSMLDGDKEAMQRFGGILLLFIAWLFLVPELIKYMFGQASNSTSF